MNERIKKLAKQAFESTTDPNFVYEADMFANIFANSIVQECVRVCLDRHHTWRWDNELDSDSGPRDCARSIQEHFGVKE